MPGKTKVTKEVKSNDKEKTKTEGSKEPKNEQKSSKSSKNKDVEVSKDSQKSSKNKNKDVEESKSKKTNDKETSKKNKNNDDVDEDEEEPKDKRNGLTILAGCEFNVNYTKNRMVEYLSRYSVTVVNKETSVRTERPIKIYKSACAALTGVDEVLTSKLVNAAGERALKGVNGLIKISEENMMDSVKLNKELKAMFEHHLDSYDNSQQYQTDVQISKADLTRYVETKCLNGNSAVTLDSGAQNFLMFVIRKSRIMLTETAFQISQCYSKTSLNERGILYAIKIVFPPGELQKAVFKKAENASTRVKSKDTKRKDKSDKEDEGKNKDKSTKKDSKSSSTKKDTKSNKKNNNGKESDSESDNESDKGSDDDESDNDESDNDESDNDESGNESASDSDD